MKKLRIEPGCTTCGLCEFIAPNIFEVTDISHVKPDAPIEKYEQEIADAIEQCPVQVITYTKENDHETS